jgi:hypothetical protein
MVFIMNELFELPARRRGGYFGDHRWGLLDGR